MKETVLNFGPSAALVGILARPENAGESTEPGLAVVIVNAGVIHRVGPGRLHVRLARTLAHRGTPCFRIDLPGIGDSRTLGTGGSVIQENIAGIAAAFDALERRGVARRFVVFGLCSGADHAFIAACHDPRIVGVLMVDPTRTFPTWKSHSLRFCRWLVRPSAWLRFLLGHYNILAQVRRRLRPAPANTTPREGQPAASSSGVEKRAVEDALKALVARRVNLCYLITGSLRDRYNYRRQFLDAFPGIGLEELTQVEIFPNAIHTLPREPDRLKLEQTVAAWLADRFPTSPDAPVHAAAGRPPRAVLLNGAIKAP